MPVVSRRTLLVAGPVVVLAGCTAEKRSAAPARTPPADELLKRTVAAHEARILEMYAAAALAYPDLAEPLAPFVRRHEEHRDAVRPRASDTPTASATEPSPTSRPGEDPAAAIAALAEAEADAAEARRADCLRADDGELARLLASIAACEALHEISVARL